MKIIITELTIKKIISNHLEKMFNDINYSYGYDDDGNEVDYAIEFYVGDYDDDDTIFRWYGKDYWDIEDDSPTLNLQTKKDESPILEVYQNNELIIESLLNSIDLSSQVPTRYLPFILLICNNFPLGKGLFHRIW